MNWGSILGVIGALIGTYEVDQSIILSGGVATTPKVTIGSDGGKTLYTRVQLSTDPTFGGTAS